MGKQEGKKLTKKGGTKKREAASPSPSGGGDVRGNGGIWWLTKSRVTASPRPSRGGDVPRGIWNAGCWGNRRTKI